MITALILCGGWRKVGALRIIAAVALIIGADVLVGIAVAALLGARAGLLPPCSRGTQ